MEKHGFFYEDDEQEADEDLPNFFNSIRIA
jgi:hypothetical protein